MQIPVTCIGTFHCGRCKTALYQDVTVQGKWNCIQVFVSLAVDVWCLAENSWHVSATCKCLQFPCVCVCVFWIALLKRLKIVMHILFTTAISTNIFLINSVQFVSYIANAQHQHLCLAQKDFKIFWQHHAHHKIIFFNFLLHIGEPVTILTDLRCSFHTLSC